MSGEDVRVWCHCPICSTGFYSDIPVRTGRDRMTIFCERCAGDYRRMLTSKLIDLGVPQAVVERLDDTDWTVIDRAKVESLASDFREGRLRGLYIWGPVGTGKTHLSAWLLREWLAHHQVIPNYIEGTVAWLDGTALSELLTSQGRTSTDMAIERAATEVRHYRLVILDDILGRYTDAANRLAETILLERLDKGRPVVANSNHPSESLDPRIQSRLSTDWCRVIVREGRDMRRRHGR